MKAAPAGDEWVHEIKFDGYRIVARRDGPRVALLTRRRNDWTDRLPTVRAAVARLPAKRLLLDGEVAVVLPDGRTSFQALQNAVGRATAPDLVYFVFDLLHLDGEDVGAAPLEQRKARLAALLAAAGDGPIRYADHLVGRGPEVLQQACARGLEGIVSKRRDLPYQPGRRGGWLKIKCLARQELVIGGFTDPEGSRAGIGALLVGYHDADGRLVFAGKVGTGFTQRTLVALRRRLAALEQPRSPFAVAPPTGWLGRHAHWVRPELVAEVAFSEWTGDGRLRHPSFQGLRDDTPAPSVVRERPASLPAADPPRTPARTRREAATAVAGQRLTHPERVLYPERGLTKLDLAHYYARVAEWILPHLRDRPLTLVRCPEGIAEPCFYMKHSRVWSPPGLRKVRIREKTKIGEYLVVDDVLGLMGLVQMGVLEIHTWNSTATDVERPDRIVLDLDPGPAVAWTDVVAAARLVRDALASVGLESFVKTTGGKGLHVVVPLEPAEDWSTCFAFSRAIAEAIVREQPRRYTTAMPKRGRERKILIDYLRNNRTNTSVAAFSTRARPGAPVSVPVGWDELGRVHPDALAVETVPRRLASMRRDPWARYWTLRQRLDRAVAGATR